jgi:recombination protein RecR
MGVIPEPVSRLIEAFSALPGIGPKTASRLTYYLLRAPDALSLNLAEALAGLKAQTKLCSVCCNITVSDPCPICSDPRRDQTTIAVVEEPLDVLALERTGIYQGTYHVLQGAISPVNGIGPDDLKIKELVQRVASKHVQEVIVATNPGMEGDATAMYPPTRASAFQRKAHAAGARLPMGGDLEYVDSVTVLRALQGRTQL